MELVEVDGKIVEATGPKPHVEFYEHPKKAGVGKFNTVIYIKIKPRGCRDFMSRLATKLDEADYPKEWAAFQQGINVEEGSTPFGQLPSFKTAFQLELRAKGINCVEELAAIEKPTEEYLVPLWKQARVYVQLMEAENDDSGQEV